jgi:hypothetical protein
MGTTLTGTTPQDTYDSLIKVTDNGPLSGTAKYLSDGLGNDSVLALSTSRIAIGSTIDSGELITAYGAAEAAIVFQNTNSGTGASQGLYLGTLNAENYLWTYENQPLIIATNNAERMRITPAGDVGVGYTSPTQKLSVAGNIKIAGAQAGNVAKLNMTRTDSSWSINNETDLRFYHSNSDTDSPENIRVAFTSAGNVGIGTSAPTVRLQVRQDVPASTSLATTLIRLYNESDGGAAISMDNGVGGKGALAFSAESTGGGTDDIALIFSNSFNGSALTERMRLTSDGYLRMASGSLGIQFNGDTAAANALDDYEEGTWTMGVSFGGASVGVTYINNAGRYTKIGRQVTASGYLALSSKGSSTGDAEITGLPFTNVGIAAGIVPVTLRYDSVSFTNTFQGFLNAGETKVLLGEITVLGTATNLTNADFQNGSSIMVSVTYTV